MLPGKYTLSLLADGKVLESKPLTIVMDPEVTLTGPARVRYNALLLALHDLQQRSSDVAARIAALNTELVRVAPSVDSGSTPPAVRSEFAALRKSVDAVRTTFGLNLLGGAPGGGRGGGAAGGRGGAAGGATPAAGVSAGQSPAANFAAGLAAQAAANARLNALGRLSTVKTAIQGVWETPSPEVLKQAADARAALVAADANASAVIARAKRLSAQLDRTGIKLVVPPL